MAVRQKRESYFVYVGGIAMTVWPDKSNRHVAKTITNYQIPPSMRFVRSYALIPEMEIVREFRGGYFVVQSEQSLRDRVLEVLKMLEKEKTFPMLLITITCLDDLILFKCRRNLLDIAKVEKTYDILNKVKALALGTTYKGEQTVALERAVVLGRKICEL